MSPMLFRASSWTSPVIFFSWKNPCSHFVCTSRPQLRNVDQTIPLKSASVLGYFSLNLSATLKGDFGPDFPRNCFTALDQFNLSMGEQSCRCHHARHKEYSTQGWALFVISRAIAVQLADHASSWRSRGMPFHATSFRQQKQLVEATL